MRQDGIAEAEMGIGGAEALAPARLALRGLLLLIGP